MKRLLVTAALASLVVSSAFAQVRPINPGPGGFDPRVGLGPTALGNQDSCDISVAPAATLLLPYFNVDAVNTDRTTAVDTLFTITNVSDTPAIAHITVWTDWSYPVLDFNVYLTGYDVQGISIYDILNRGNLPATSINSTAGPRSQLTNPHFSNAAASACVGLGGTGVIPSLLLQQVNSALTGGGYFNCGQVGNAHANAIGYITADVANTCSQSLPNDPNYYASEILFDNQLIGDFQRINPSTASGNFAGGNPLVHIKAVPPGGLAGSVATVTLPNTFYDRYTPRGNRTQDRRQPLPAQFAARYIGAGSGFATQYLIWREGVTGTGDCNATDYSANASFPFTEIVRFDERENPFTQNSTCNISPCPPSQGLPETSAQSITGTTVSAVFPPNTATTDGGGWSYLNLDNPTFVDAFSNGNRASQNWVVIEMTAEGRYGVDFDAAYLANGCSPSVGVTSAGRTGTPRIGPGYGVNGQVTP